MSTLPPFPSQIAGMSPARICRNGHDVPSSRTECGVCGEPLAVTAPVEANRRPSKTAWVALGVLAIVAIVIPLLNDDVLLADDFTTPEVLRTWPDDGASAAYIDGAYHLVVLSAGGSTGALHDLPRSVAGMTIEIDMRSLGGAPMAVVMCASDWSEVAVPGSDEATDIKDVTGYAFLFDLSTDRYAIMTIDDDAVLSSGVLANDGGHRLIVRCASGDGDGTTLTIQIGTGKPVEISDADDPDAFRGVGLGATSESAGSGIAFDNLRVVPTD